MGVKKLVSDIKEKIRTKGYGKREVKDWVIKGMRSSITHTSPNIIRTIVYTGKDGQGM
jgi:hypothetical protein